MLCSSFFPSTRFLLSDPCVHSHAVPPSSAQAVLRQRLKPGVLSALRNLKRNPQKWHPWTENSDRYVSLSATYSTKKKSPPQGTKGEVCVVGTGRKHSWFLCCEKSEKKKNVVPCKVLGTVAKFPLCRSTRRSQVCQVRVLCLCS